MISISQDEADSILQAHYGRIWRSATYGFEQWKKYPNRPKHLRRTRANIIHDLMMDKAIQEFDDVPNARPLELHGGTLRFLVLDDRIALWFKKVDGARKPSNYPTPAAMERHAGQFSLFPDASIIVVGYELNRDETKIKRVSVSLPNGHQRPAWFIDIERPEPKVLTLTGGGDGSTSETTEKASPKRRIRVRKGEIQLGLSES